MHEEGAVIDLGRHVDKVKCKWFNLLKPSGYFTYDQV
jgi:hypothetical protein